MIFFATEIAKDLQLSFQTVRWVNPSVSLLPHPPFYTHARPAGSEEPPFDSIKTTAQNNKSRETRLVRGLKTPGPACAREILGRGRPAWLSFINSSQIRLWLKPRPGTTELLGVNTGRKFSDVGLCSIFFICLPGQMTENKQMGLHQMKQRLQSEGNHQQHVTTALVSSNGQPDTAGRICPEEQDLAGPKE